MPSRDELLAKLHLQIDVVRFRGNTNAKYNERLQNTIPFFLMELPRLTHRCLTPKQALDLKKKCDARFDKYEESGVIQGSDLSAYLKPSTATKVKNDM